tara:strand:- start:2784 stop:4565 length:1782 start_codon:yes stop_codon:yes gene_type:complete
MSKLNENAGPGHTSWSPLGDGSVSTMYSTGYMSKIFAKFFATAAQEKLAAQGDPRGREGDLIVNKGALDSLGSPVWGYSKGSPILPEAELNRKRRYDEFEKMDDYPEITAALDIYADDCTQRDLRNKRWRVRSDSVDAIKEVEKLFERVRMDEVYWDIIRGCCKYGDTFIEVVANANNMSDGIRKIKILNPYYILRIEDQFGYLKTFMQEIPEKGGSAWQTSNSQFLELDKNQIVHFRLHTSDPKYYPYGKSIMAGAVRVYRSLKLMEDAMLVYRLSRAPERRIFYIDVGNLPSSKAEAFMETIKTRFKKEKFHTQGKVDARYNPLAVDEDFFVPIRGNQGTKIETLPGAQNLGEVDDVKYFRDKLLATLKIPKDYIVEYDKSPERKANLSQLDVKFARVIKRIQDSLAVGFRTVAKKHLKMVGYPRSIYSTVDIDLPDASDVFIKRKIEIDEARARLVQAVVGTGLFPTSHIYREIYDLTDTEVEIIKKELEEQQEKDSQAEQEQMQAQTGIETQGAMDQQQNQAELGAQSAEHQADLDIKVDKATQPPKPTAKKEEVEYLTKLKDKYMLEEGLDSPRYKAISRVLKNKNKF